MKNLLLLISLFAFVTFSSCTKEKINKNKSDKKEYDKKEKKDWNKGKGLCFELIYPVTYTMPDGTNITGDDEDAVWIAIKAWYESNLDSEVKPELQYPVNILLKEGVVKLIVTEDEMILAKKDCYEKEDEDGE